MVVNNQLQTSDPAIYALGDCAEINGMVLPFLQPILLSAMCLSKNLLAQAGELKLPPMLVKVKTPDLPLHLAGDTRRDDLTWNIVAAKEGLVAKGLDAENQLRAFVVSEDKMKEAFALLKQLKRVDFPTLGRPTIPAFNAIVLSCFFSYCSVNWMQR